jgi:hypothetical protein
MNEIILYIGLGIFIIGSIGFLIAAFRTSILWGLAVLLIAPTALFYLITHWQDSKGPFKAQVFGFLIMLLSAYLNGGINIPGTAKSVLPPSHESASKCVSTTGETYYGDIPSGVACKSSSTLEIFTSSENARQSDSTENFKCDGREYCSQMTSCAEAMYFNKNCPNTKMSGDGDGIPCEKQWCGHY